MNHYLYLLLDLGSLSIPLLYSVLEKEFHFIQYFKIAFFSIVLVVVPFLIWDVIFTSYGVWGFNSDYHLSLKILGMPIEEWLFFFCIPYACLFTHEVLKYYLPNFKLSKKITNVVGIFFIVLSVVLLFLNIDKWYTMINFLFFTILMTYTLVNKFTTLQEYVPSFCVILIPFFLVNGVLTGSFIDQPIVWYNDNQNMEFRVATIPLEDIFYAFNLLFSIQLVFNCLKKKAHE